MKAGQSLTSGDRARLNRVVRLLAKEFADPWTVEEMAERAGTGVEELTRVLRAALGVTPMQYLATVRVEAAKDLLLAGRTVAYTSRVCGFRDQPAFSAQFRKITGIYASHYRYETLGPKFGEAAIAARAKYAARHAAE